MTFQLSSPLFSNEKEFDLWLESHRPPTIYAEWGDLSGNLEDLSSEMHNLRSLFKQGGWKKVRESLKINHDYFVEFTDKDDFDSILSTESCTKTLFKKNGDYRRTHHSRSYGVILPI